MICNDNYSLTTPLFNGNLLESTGCNWSIVDNSGQITKLNCDVILKHSNNSGWTDGRLGFTNSTFSSKFTFTRKIYGLVPDTEYSIAVLLQKKYINTEVLNNEYLKVIIGANTKFFTTTINKNSSQSNTVFTLKTDANGELIYYGETNSISYLVRVISGSCIILDDFIEYPVSSPLDIGLYSISDEENTIPFSSSSISSSSSSSESEEDILFGNFDKVIPVDNERELIELYSSVSSSESLIPYTSSSYSINRTPVGVSRMFSKGNNNIVLLSDKTIWGMGDNLGNILLQPIYNIIDNNDDLLVDSYYNTVYKNATKIEHTIVGNADNIKNWEIGEVYEPNLTNGNIIPYCQVLDISGNIWSWGATYNTDVTKNLIINNNISIIRNAYPEIGRTGADYSIPSKINSDNFDLENGIIGVGQNSVLHYDNNFITYIGNGNNGIFGGGLVFEDDVKVATRYKHTKFIPKQIEIGSNNSLLLDISGNVYSSGTIEGNYFVNIGISGSLNNSSYISSKFETSLITKSDGKVYIYGNNSTFLDDNIYDMYTQPSEIVKFGEDFYDTIKDMITKGTYGAMITNTGNVWVWGRWDNGSYTGNNILPVKVQGISGASNIVVSDDNEILVNTSDGKLYGAVNQRTVGAYILPSVTYNGLSFTELPEETQYIDGFYDASSVVLHSYASYIRGVSGKFYGSGRGETPSIQEITSIDNIKKITSIGDSVGVIVLKSDGTLWIKGSSTGYYLHGMYPNYGYNYYFSSYTLINTISNVQDVYANRYGVSAITSDGNLYGWGYNAYCNILSSPSNNIVLTPTLNTDISDCKKVKLSTDYIKPILVLKSDNTLWGRGYQQSYDILGVGNLNMVTSSFVKIPNANDVRDFYATHTKGLIVHFNDGSISGSGYLYNQGLNGYTSGEFASLGITNVKKIVVDAYHNIAMLSNGEVWAVGTNDYNRLGLSNNVNSYEQVMGIPNAIDIATNTFGSMIVTSDNRLMYTGTNNENMFGDVNTSEQTSSYKHIEILTNSNKEFIYSSIDKMVCNGRNMFIKKSNGDLWCWGQNNNMLPLSIGAPLTRPWLSESVSEVIKIQSAGSYGLTYLTSISGGHIVTKSPNLNYDDNTSNIKDLVGGDTYNIVIKNDGTVWGLGYSNNDYYNRRLYNINRYTTVSSLTQILPDVNNAKKIVSMRDGTTSIILTSDDVIYTNMLSGVTYGSITEISNIKDIYPSGHVLTSDGDLWNITTFYRTLDNNNTVHKMNTGTDKISWVSSIKNDLYSGRYHYQQPLFIQGDIRGLLSIGSNYYLEGGYSPGSYNSTFVPVQYDSYLGSNVQYFTNAKKSKVGKDFSVVLTSDGEVYTSGKSNAYGQLGREESPLNTRGYFLVSNLNSVDDIYCGEHHVLVKRSNGTIWTWGRNDYGQIATNDLINVSFPTQVGTISADQIAVGNNHNIVIDINNEVYVWGRNDYGQLGTGTFDNKSSLYKWVDQHYDITDIISNGDNTYYIKSDNIIYGTGINSNGQLSQGALDLTPKSDLIKLKKLDYLQQVKKIKSPYSHTICLYSNGEISTWGNNSNGELGINGFTEVYNPITPINNVGDPLNNIKDVESGKGYSMALTSTGKVWSWGDNLYGKLGHGQFRDSSEWIGINDMTNQSYSNSNVAKTVKELTSITNISSIGGINKYNTFVTTSFNTTLSVGDSEFSNFKYTDYIPSIFNETSISGIGEIIVQKDNYYILNNGEVWSWGKGSFYRTLLNNDDNITVPTKTALTGVNDIVSSDYNTYVLYNDNTLYGVGVKRQDITSGNSNLPNIIGDDSTISSTLSIVDSEVSYISIGGNYTTLGYVKNGEVLFRGANRNNLWGNGGGNLTNVARRYITPTTTEVISEAVSIDIGGEYSVIVDNMGDVYWTGYEYSTELENSSYFKKVPDITNIQKVCPLYYKLLMLHSNGDLYSYDFLNNPTIIESNVLDIKYYSNGFDNSLQIQDEGAIIHISGGGIKTSGVYNGYGRLGLFGNSTTNGLFESSVTYQDMDNVKEIYCNKDNAYFLKSDNKLYGVGYNNTNLGKSEVEYVTMTHGESIISTDQLIFPTYLMDNVENIIHSHDTVITIVSGGHHYIWGNMVDGQRGEGFSESSGLKKSFYHTEYKEMHLGKNHVSMVTSEGDIYSWGSNLFGQSGLGKTKIDDYIIGNDIIRYYNSVINDYFPEMTYNYQLQNDIVNIKTIRAGKDNVYITKSDNSIWGWGNDNYRQSLGDNIDSYNDNDLYKVKKLNVANFSKENSAEIISKVQGEDITIKDIYLQDEYMVVLDIEGNAYSKGLTNTFSQLGTDDSYRIDTLEPLYYENDISLVNREDFILQDGTKEKWFDDDQLLLTYDTDNIVSVNFPVKKLIVGFKLIGLEFTGISSEDKVIIKFYGSDDDINKIMLGHTIVDGNRNLKQLFYNNTIMYSYYYVTFHKIENTLLDSINVTINNFEFFERTANTSPFEGLIKWGYQLQNINLTEVKNSDFDLMVLDYSSDGSESGEYTLSQINDTKGNSKIFLSYISIGEAENYRFYWDDTWTDTLNSQPNENAPSWLGLTNPDWVGNYKVEYWNSDWKQLVYSYIDRIIDAGFDGIYLDIIDAYEYWGVGGESGVDRPTAEQEMVDFVKEIAYYTRVTKGKTNFFIFPQNGEALSSYIDYVNIVDGIGREDIWYDGNNSQTSEDIEKVTIDLDVFKNKGKLILSIDYPTDENKRNDYYSLSTAKGYMPYVSTRDLDQLTNNTYSVDPVIAPQDRKVIVDVSLGLYHSIYRLDDGTVYTLGNNLFGQLGNNSSYNHNMKSNLLTKVSDILNIKKIIASSYAQSFALASDGTLYGWGFNAHGELGIPDRNNRLLPDIINVNGQIVKDIASSYKTAYAITNDNNLWAWGDNEDGMIGDGTMVDRYSPTILTSDVVLVEANVSNVAYIKNDGSLWLWGYNKTGQLGNGTTDDSIVPLKVNIDNVMDVKFGKGVTYALKSDGTIWAWGNNDKGQLGQMMGDNTNIQEYLQKGYTLEPTINPSELLYNSNSDTVQSSISLGKGKNKYLPKMLTTLHDSDFDVNGWKIEYVQTLLNKGFKKINN